MDFTGALHSHLYAYHSRLMRLANEKENLAVLEAMVALRVYLLEGRPPYATGYVIFSVWCAHQILTPPDE